MGEAQRLDPRPRVLTPPRFVEQRPHACVLPGLVVGLGRQPDAQPHRQRRPRLDDGECVPQPRLHRSRGRAGAVLVHPQPTQAQRGPRHRRTVAGDLRPLVGSLEVPPARPQVAVVGQGTRPQCEQVIRRRGRHGQRGAGSGQRRFLAQDRDLEVAHHRAGVDAQVRAQRGAQRAERAERIGLPPGPVEREHQEFVDPLVERPLPGQPFQLRHQRGHARRAPSALRSAPARPVAAPRPGARPARRATPIRRRRPADVRATAATPQRARMRCPPDHRAPGPARSSARRSAHRWHRRRGRARTRADAPGSPSGYPEPAAGTRRGSGRCSAWPVSCRSTPRP